jgi:hypothetical protein
VDQRLTRSRRELAAKECQFPSKRLNVCASWNNLFLQSHHSNFSDKKEIENFLDKLLGLISSLLVQLKSIFVEDIDQVMISLFWNPLDNEIMLDEYVAFFFLSFVYFSFS